MKNLIKKMLLLPATFFVCATAMAQDADFMQFFNNPVYTNPAAAGSGIGGRASLSHRMQWPALPGSWTTAAIAIDQNFESLHGGVGIIALLDRAGEGVIKTSTVNGIYACEAKLNNKISVRVGAEAAYYRKSIDFSKIKFIDGLPLRDPRTGFTFLQTEPLPRDNRTFANFASGILVYSKAFYAGFAVHNLTEPNLSFYNKKELAHKLPARYTFNAGFTVLLNEKVDVKSRRITLSPNLILMQQDQFRQAGLNMNVSINHITAGAGYRLTDDYNFVSALVGFKGSNVNIFYSADLTYSHSRPAPVLSHEISMALKWRCKSTAPENRILCEGLQ